MMKRPQSSEIPDRPGAYLFKNARGEVIYAGKAKSLRKRIASYFVKSPSSRTLKLISEAASLDWMITTTEAEAILLEFNLIKEHRPRYNILLKDDKSFPYLGVTVDEEWPRPAVMRGPMRRGIRYFGPYAHVRAVRETLDLLIRTFPLRTCSNRKLKEHTASGKPCLYFHIERCSGPCIGAISAGAYAELASEFCKFLDGDDRAVRRRIEAEMREASGNMEYEVAARKRDELASLCKVVEHQQAISTRSETFDAISVVEDEMHASIQVFTVRRGRLIGRRGYVVEKTEELDSRALLGRVLQQVYGPSSSGNSTIIIPRQILIENQPADLEACVEFLELLRGGPVEIRVPLRGEKREFMATVRQNAIDALNQQKLRRATDYEARSKALKELQGALELPEVPLRIECFDISNSGPDEIVGSMVVLEDGLPKSQEYRRFRIRNQTRQDDFMAMAEVIGRRFSAYKDAVQRSDGHSRFSYRPSLVLVDGGPGQVRAAMNAIDSLGIKDIAVAGLAKRFEEIYLPGRKRPITLDRTSDALHLLQRVRDEAHRFANSYHRRLRAKAMKHSVLDGIDGVGEKRKKHLIRHFGSIKRIRSASLEEIKSVPGMPSVVAENVYVALGGQID